MGVPGLWDVLRPTGELRSLTDLAVRSGFESSSHRAYRMGIDASIWFFHAQGGREGENPELRTLFFRCSRLLAMPFLPIFVFDGPKRPKIKRGKAVGGKEHWMVNNLRTVLDAFGFECRTAPGEAEAELAFLNRIGVIDAVLSDDVDCFIFGAYTVIRNSSATLSGNRSHGAKNANGKDDGQHAYVYQSNDIQSDPTVNLSLGGLILIALLRGGDYDQQGIDGCGVSTAHALARAGFGDSLLTAARSPTPGALEAFLPTWRVAIRHELRTNSLGLAPRKSPTLAQRISENFPRLDVLRCYTHPITSESQEAGARGLNSLWKKQADVAKIAHVCEMYFEWGVEETVIKRFRSFLWPGAVFRELLQIALEKDNQNRTHTSTPPKRTGGGVETPSKALAQTLRGMVLDAESDNDDDDDDDDGFNLVIGIHGERRHASTDDTLEYRLEIDPRGLVARARSGIQGLRTELEDSAAAGVFDDDEDEDEGGKKKKYGPKTPPPDPDSKLRVWMPAVMVQYAYPILTKDYLERKTAKEEKKNRGKGKKGKVRQEDSEEDESTPGKHVKAKSMMMKHSKKAEKVKVSDDIEGSNDDLPIGKVMVKVGTARETVATPAKPTLTTSSSNPHSPQSKIASLLTDEDPFLVSTTRNTRRNLEPKTKEAIRPLLGIEQSSPSKSSLAPRPFPMDLGGVPAPPRHRHIRKHSFNSAFSADFGIARAPLKKSPHKSPEHTSPHKPTRGISQSQRRPLLAPKMRPLHRATARVTSKSDEIIIISSDSDDGQPNMKTSAKPLDSRALTPANLNFETEFIDLT